MVDTLTPMTFINKIVEALFSHEEKRLNKFIEDLLRQNIEMTGKIHDGFLFNGNFYCSQSLPKGTRTKLALHDNLSEQMREHLMDVATIRNDQAFIKQVLFLLLHPCNSLQQMRDTLPDALADFIPDFQKLPRTNEQGYTLTEERAKRQFAKVLDKIQFYSATRYLY